VRIPEVESNFFTTEGTEEHRVNPFAQGH
jgi:hypothetical protein